MKVLPLQNISNWTLWINFLLLMLHIKGFHSADIFEVGSVAPGRAVNQGAALQGSDAYLTDYVINSDGLLFVFSTEFHSSNLCHVQLYEQQPATNQTYWRYRLVADVPVIPSVVGKHEDIYLESLLTQKCIRARKGQRLGVYFPGSLISVRYSFNTTVGVHKSLNTMGSMAVGQTVEFDTIMLPYAMALSVHILPQDFGTTNDTLVDCIRGLVIPDSAHEVTTVNPGVGAPGATGPPGPKGPRGATGPQGLAPPGPAGAPGSPGDAGSTGYTGASGQPGAIGASGSFGVVGPTGNTGLAGPVGFTGATGPAGPIGPPGQDIIVPVWGDWSNKTTAAPPRTENLVSEQQADFWKKKDTIIGAYIWLAIVSFIILMSLLIISVTGLMHCTSISNGGQNSKKTF